jgi:hypothetical protein
MVIAAPSMVPEAAAAGQLFVSAENATFDNHFAGIQVVEIIVKDPNRILTSEAQSEPTVKVDEHLLRLAQAQDGYWYAYIADSTNVATAHAANNSSETHIHFGYQVSDEVTVGSVSFDSATTAYHTAAIVAGAPTLSSVLITGAIDADGVGNVGQIGMDNAKWPVVQTFDFTIETFEIKLEQPGADEIVVLTHDNDDIDNFAGIELDRSQATNGAYVHATITDQALNIDPTTEDVVMFNVTAGSEGVSFKATSDYTSSQYVAFDNSFDDNGKLKINYDANSSSTDVLTDGTSADDATADKYLIFWETAENSGVFVNTDDADVSNLTVNSSALRGTTATFDYADSAQSFLVAHDFATIDMDASSVGDEWNSGEEMTIVLYDQDLNLNTASDEDLTVAGGTLVPSIQIGSPVSTSSTATTISGSNTAINTATQHLFSKITNADISAGDTTLVINTGLTGADVYAIAATYNSFNVDVSSFGTISNVIVCETTTYTDGDTCTGETILLTTATTTGKFHDEFTTQASNDADEDIIVEVTLSSSAAQTDAPFVIDFFSFSDSVNNAIYRVELEETGDNTATFEGSAEYVMLN